MYVNLNRDVARFDGPGQPSKENRERAMEMATPLTPRSERPRRSWGSLAVSLQAVGGLCVKGKCFKKQDHEGACYPS